MVEAGVYATASEGFEHGLVVLAAGAPYWLVPGPEGHRLLVEAAVAARVRVQLARFDRESAHWPPKPLVFANPHATDLITPLLWAAVVLVVHYQQQTRPQWAEAGALDAAGIFDRGEWWRVGTALWLHADGGHAVSNALMGVLLFTAVLKTLGAVPGWLWVAAAGLGGNLVVAAVNYPGPYRSLGASTAIFGGLGLLTGHMVKLLAGSGHPHRGRAIFVALGAGWCGGCRGGGGRGWTSGRTWRDFWWGSSVGTSRRRLMGASAGRGFAFDGGEQRPTVGADTLQCSRCFQ